MLCWIATLFVSQTFATRSLRRPAVAVDSNQQTEVLGPEALLNQLASPLSSSPNSGIVADDDIGSDNDLAPLRAAPEPILALNVGTQPGLSDVVLHGLVQRDYQGGSAAIVPAEDPASAFFISLDPTAFGGLQTADIADIHVESLNTSVVTATVLRPLRRPGGRRSLSLLATGKPAACLISYECSATGSSNVRIELKLKSPNALSPVILLEKVCKGTNLPGLAVGTTSGSDDVAQDGKAKWTRRNSPLVPFERSEVPLFVTMLSPDHGGQKFAPLAIRVTPTSWGLDYIDNPPAESASQQAHRDGNPQAGKYSDNPPLVLHKNANVGAHNVASVSLSSMFDQGGSLEVDKSEEIVLKFECLNPGTTLVELVLTPTPAYEPYKPMSVFLVKVCGGAVKSGLMVGTSAGGDDLVSDGKRLNPLADVGGLTHASHFFVQYFPFGPDDPQQAVNPTLRCVPAQGDPNELVPAEAKLVKSDDLQTFDVFYSCRKAGLSKCTLDLGLRFYRSVGLTWNKNCGGSRPDVLIESDLQSFMTVFSSGSASAPWSASNPEVELPVEEENATFTVRVNESAINDDEPVALDMPYVKVSDPSILEVNLVGSESLASRVLAQKADKASVIAHHKCVGNGEVTVHMKFPFAGHWPKPMLGLAQTSAHSHGKGTSKIDPVHFSPAAFSYRKRCGVFHIEAMYVMIAAVGTLFVASVACMGVSYFKFKDLPKDPEPQPAAQVVSHVEEEEEEEELYG